MRFYGLISRLVFGVMTLVCVSACGPSEVGETLVDVESFMDERPDSALTVLRGIEVKDMNRASDRALYAVLLTQALDKSHEPLAETDSIISEAVEYYSHNSSDTRRSMLANYFNGRVKYQTEDYPESLVAMFKAHDLATEIDDKFWMGMSARGIADVYRSTYNAADAVRYSEIELENLKLTDKYTYIHYAMLDLAISLCNNREIERSQQLLKEIADSAHVSGDTFLYNEAIRSMAVSYISENENDKAIEAYRVIFASGSATLKDSIYLGVAYSRRGMAKKGMDLFKHMEKSNKYDYWLRYEVYKKAGMIDSAFVNLEKMNAEDNSLFMGRVNLGLATSLAKYYDLSKYANAMELKNARMLSVGIFIGFMIILAVILYFIIRYYRIYKGKMRQNYLLAKNLREVLSMKKTECVEAQNTVRLLLDKRIEIVETLCRTYRDQDNSALIYRRIDKAMKDFRTEIMSKSGGIGHFESLVNQYYDNVMQDLRSEFPSLKEVDYNVYLFSVLGFSSSTIMFFLKEEKVEVIYERKRRMKDRIKRLSKFKQRKYLKYFE